MRDDRPLTFIPMPPPPAWMLEFDRIRQEQIDAIVRAYTPKRQVDVAKRIEQA